MGWRLLLDDERFPPYPTYGGDEWRIARNVDDAMWYISNYGMPDHMALDHDLGAGKLTGMDFCRTLAAYLMDNGIKPTFTFDIISQNPAGRDNMQSYLDKFIELHSV